jgi:hypothetical protein
LQAAFQKLLQDAQAAQGGSSTGATANASSTGSSGVSLQSFIDSWVKNLGSNSVTPLGNSVNATA